MELGGRRLSMTKWAKKTEKERKKERKRERTTVFLIHCAQIL